MTIRKFIKNDYENIIDMMIDFYNSPAVLHDVNHKNFEFTVKEAASDSPYTDIFIAEEDGKILGYALTSVTWSNEAGGIVVWIEEIFIKEGFRSMGIGSKFIDFTENYYKKAVRFRLETEPSNKQAESLYKRKGYDYLNYNQMIKDR